MAEPIEMPFGRMTCVGPRNHVLDWCVLMPCSNGHFRGGHMPVIIQYRDIAVWMSCALCIAHCSPAAVGECACPAHVTDECIHNHEG